MDKSFILYTDIGPSILELKDAEVGRLTKAIYRYVMTGECTELKGSVKICFNMIRSHLDRDKAKYPTAFLSRQDILTVMKEFPKDYEKRIARLNRFIIDNDFPCEDPVNTIRIWATQEACREKGQKDRNKDWGRLGV